MSTIIIRLIGRDNYDSFIAELADTATIRKTTTWPGQMRVVTLDCDTKELADALAGLAVAGYEARLLSQVTIRPGGITPEFSSLIQAG